MARTIAMVIIVEAVDEATVWDDALSHYEQQGRGDMEANAYTPAGQELDLPHAILEASLAWMAETDLKLVKTEVSDLTPDGHANEEELTLAQASAYALGLGQHLSNSFLARAAKTGKIQGRKIVPRTGGVGYWMLKKAALMAYLASERRPGRKKVSTRQDGYATKSGAE